MTRHVYAAILVAASDAADPNASIETLRNKVAFLADMMSSSAGSRGDAEESARWAAKAHQIREAAR